MNLKTRLDNIEHNIGYVDGFAVDVLSRLATWTAPAVPAVLTYGAMQTYLDAGPALAFTAALSIELLGLGTVSNLLNAAEYNRHVDPARRLGLAPYRAMAAGYVALVVWVVLGLKAAPASASWVALLGLSLLTLLSATSFTQRRQLAGLAADLEPRLAPQPEPTRPPAPARRKQAPQPAPQPQPAPTPTRPATPRPPAKLSAPAAQMTLLGGD